MGGLTTNGAEDRSGDVARILRSVAPVVVLLVMLVALFGFVRGVSALRSWDTNYAGTGSFTVTGCSVEVGRLADQVRCDGTLRLTQPVETINATVVGPKAAFGSVTPRPGTELEVYHRIGVTDEVFPAAGRSTEFARSFVGVVPLFFVAIGAALWLVGWLLTRGISRQDAERRIDRYRFPTRFVLRPRGALWALLGIGWFVFDRYAVDGLVGSAGLG